MECVRTRKPNASPVASGVGTAAAAHLANESVRSGRTAEWAWRRAPGTRRPMTAPSRRLLPLAALLLLAAPARAGRPPNLVVILADDMGYGDAGCYGSKTIRTPNIDRLAREGTRFTSFYVAQPVCTASRARCSRAATRTASACSAALNHESRVGLGLDELLLPELLKKRGYATAIFGKWHVGDRPPFRPLRRGFDEWLGLPYSNDNGPLHPTVKGLPPLPLYDGDAVAETDPDQSQFTRRFTERAVSFIGRNKDRPFFLYVPHVMPHVPIFASPAFKGRSAAGLYGDVIEELDWRVGEVLAALRSTGWRRTRWCCSRRTTGRSCRTGRTPAARGRCARASSRRGRAASASRGSCGGRAGCPPAGCATRR